MVITDMCSHCLANSYDNNLLWNYLTVISWYTLTIISSDKLILDNRKNVTENRKTESNGYPRVEITHKDVAEESESYLDSNSNDLAPETPLSTKAFEIDDSERLRPDSLYYSAGVSDDESSPVSAPDLPDKNRASIMSVTSNISQSERVVQEIIATEQTYVEDLEEIINVRISYDKKYLLAVYNNLYTLKKDRYHSNNKSWYAD